MNHIRNSYVSRILNNGDKPSNFHLDHIRLDTDEVFGRLRAGNQQCIFFFDKEDLFNHMIHQPDRVGYPWEEDYE